MYGCGNGDGGDVWVLQDARGLAEGQLEQCSGTWKVAIVLVDDVLEFELVVDFSPSKPQTAQFDDGGPDGVLIVAIRALVIEIVDAEELESRRWKKLCAA